MLGRELFYLCSGEREAYIQAHKFYVEQAEKRLILQFNDLDKEVEEYSEKWLDAVSGCFDPEIHSPDDFYEQAYDEGVEHGILLSEMREQTILSVLAGMYHQWDKTLREWMVRESRYWGGKNVQEAIWRVNWPCIPDLFTCIGWEIEGEDFYKKLDACRLIVNVYKHGNGNSLKDLRSKYPKYFHDFDNGNFNPYDWFDHTSVNIKDQDIKEFSEAILDFWKLIPERIFDSNNIEVPEWLSKALKKGC